LDYLEAKRKDVVDQIDK